MSVKSGYKQTEIGVIPEDWEVIKLPEITLKITSGGTPSAKPEMHSNGTVNWIKTGELRDCYIYDSEEKITEEAVINSSAKKFPVDTLLIAMYGATIGRTAYLKVESSTNQACCAIIFNPEKANTHFYWQYFLFTKETLISKGCGAGQPNISQGIIKDLFIPFPPLEEQKKIADILSTVDKKIAFVEENINATEELKKGLMQKLLTEGIGHTEFKDSELGRIPESWEVETLGKIGTFSKGKGISKNEIVENGYPCIRYAEIYTEYNFVIKEFKSFINQESANSSNKLKKNDILFAGSGETLEDIGKSVAFLFDIEAYVGGDTIILSPKDNILDSLFMAYQLNFYEVRKQLIKLGQGNSVVHIYSKGLMTVKVKLPPLEEQKQIAEILSTVDKKLENLKEKKQSFEELKKGLMQKLLTGQVRV